MAIIISNLTYGVGDGDENTASITATAGRVLLVSVFAGTGTSAVPTVSGLGLTWTKRAERNDDANSRWCTIYSAPTGAGATGVISITNNGSTLLWCVDEARNIVASSPVVQSGTNSINNASSSSITVTLSGFASTGNAAFGAIRKSDSGTITAGSGFTQLAQPASANPFYSQSQWKDSSDTTVDWSWSTATNYVQACALELNAIASPSVTTGSATNTLTISATLAGNVTSDGSGTVSERGVCWSTSANPTTSDAKANSGTGTGAYTVSATSLVPGTLYHYRAYCINEVSTAYGSDQTFTTLSMGGSFLLNLI